MKLRMGAPEEVGMCSGRLDRVRAAMCEWMAQAGQSAAVALVARRGVIVLHEAMGTLRAEQGSPPVQPDTTFWLASMSKPMTATAAMILVEEGKLGTNVPVSYYLPELTGKGKDAITILHLLTHTSGLRDQDLNEYAARIEDSTAAAPCDSTQHPVIADYLATRRSAPLWKPPGREMSYCTYGYVLLGEIVRLVSGRSLSDFAAERVFEPLGMRHTSYGLPDALVDTTAWPSEPGWASFLREYRTVPFPDSGVFSTAADVAVFVQSFLNGGKYAGARILSPWTVAEMTRNQIPGIESRIADEFFLEGCWGLGWSATQCWRGLRTGLPLAAAEAFSHMGAGGSYMWAKPAHDLVGVYLAAQDTSRTLSRYEFGGFARTQFASYQFADAVTSAIVEL
jgi:serine-type D-Ala-D-Ala carboxypeptidase